jgi:hypothetical protein
MKLSLPDQLHFTRQPRRLAKGVLTRGSGRSVKSTGDALTITLRHPVQNPAVTIVPPALIAQHQLIAETQRVESYNRHHRRKHSLKLSVQCTITDSGSSKTLLSLEIKIS